MFKTFGRFFVKATSLGSAFAAAALFAQGLHAQDEAPAELRVARAGQECTDFYELPPCEAPVPDRCEQSPVAPSPEVTDQVPDATPQADQPDFATTDDLSDTTTNDQAPGRSSLLPSGLGAVAASDSPDVNMIGDFFSSGYYLGGADGFASLPSAGGDRRFKATDNLSLLPQDRVFFNYHHFQNAVSDINGVEQDVDRFTLGLEHTFLDDTVSWEVRIPFTSGLASGQNFGQDNPMSSEVGNVAFTIKAFLWQWRSLKFGAGLATVVPTADDASVQGDSQYTEFHNDAVHLQPYFGVYCSRPGSRLFSTTYIGVDTDVSGNEILVGSAFSPGPLTSLGTIEDPALLYCDYQIGYWWYQDYGHIGYLNGIAPVFEVHYSQMLSDPENFDGAYQNPFGQASLVNITSGFIFEFRRNNQVNIYGAAPLKQDETVLFGRTVSPIFTGEFGVQWVCRY